MKFLATVLPHWLLLVMTLTAATLLKAQKYRTVYVKLDFSDTSLPKTCTLLFRDSTGKVRTHVLVHNRKLVAAQLDPLIDQWRLDIVSVYFEADSNDRYFFSAGQADTISLTLHPRIVRLREVIVSSHPSIVSRVGDTLQYDAAGYKEIGTRKVSELLRKMRGFSVGDNGRITFNGREISVILLDGEDLTGNDYKALSENLSANVVDKVQVLQNYNPN
ncbi:MAG: hypothetical protein EOO85_05995, partial [Pedobacter sp.]